MGDLAAKGIKLETQQRSADGEDVTELVYTLPKSTNVQATFSYEGLTERLVKIFKKEIQTGDNLFDEHVHIKTETPETTTRLLESSEMRQIIEGIVSDGGAVEIDGATVTVELKGRTELGKDVSEHFFDVLLR